MITLKELTWSNCFSYGRNNRINFTDNPITQLVGLNGHGKSSIALILELVLFNKNSKGTKAGKVLNRYIEDNFYKISLSFSKDDDEYFIDTKRASTQTIKLTRNGTDISAHTATNTFKLIEEILGFDHKTFVQLIYQSSAQSLEFLTATDTNRKKFLIDLLNLEKYIEAFEVFKKLNSDLTKEVDKLESAMAVVQGWLTKNANVDLTEKQVLPVPEPLTDKVRERISIEEAIKKIEETNKAININNKYKEILDSIDMTPIVLPEFIDPAPLTKAKTEAERTMRDAREFISKVKALKSHCPECNHPLDHSKQLEMVGSKELAFNTSQSEVKILIEKISKIQADNKFIEENLSKQARWEQHHALYNPELKTEILIKNDLEARVIQLGSEIRQQEIKISQITQANGLANIHNSKVAVISEQLVEMNAELAANKASLDILTHRLGIIQILSKAFSTNGLIAFKIESMVKDLEGLVNEYLSELSDGRFQLGFVISGEKLNVVISDNGHEVEIIDLSAGERARVNTATLLAIRKLMQQLSNTKVNVLILDETISNLDTFGKEKLIDILLGESHLNTYLVSHDYSHPLLEKITVVKEDNISRIE